jgi:heme exporter protein D
MTWASWSDFFAMGGYALYVWGSYAVTVAIIAAEIVLLRLRRRNIVRYLGHMSDDRSRDPDSRQRAGETV